MATRDRDAAGRPRNARPRDALGRPLGRGAAGVPALPEGIRPDPARALALAQELIDAGRPFHAHEVLEAAWKASAPPERALWRGLAQIAVGLTHALRGNERGAVALLRRGAESAGAAARARPDLLDARRAARAAARLADRIADSGLACVPAAQLRLRLAGPARADRTGAAGAGKDAGDAGSPAAKRDAAGAGSAQGD